MRIVKFGEMYGVEKGIFFKKYLNIQSANVVPHWEEINSNRFKTDCMRPLEKVIEQLEYYRLLRHKTVVTYFKI